MVKKTLAEHFDNVQKTRHEVQAANTSTCGLHTLYFIIKMIDPLNKSKNVKEVNVGNYVRTHYDTKQHNTVLKDRDITNHLSKKLKNDFDVLLTTNDI